MTNWTWTVNERKFEMTNIGWDVKTGDSWTVYDVTRLSDGVKSRFFARRFIHTNKDGSKSVEMILDDPKNVEKSFADFVPQDVWTIESIATEINIHLLD